MKHFVQKVVNQTKLFKVAGTVVLLTSAVLTGCHKDDDDDYPGKPPHIEVKVVKGSGDISSPLAEFRNILGDSLNTNIPGNPSGRREINWDGVPAQFTNPNIFPFDFFNSTDPAIGAGRKRGLVYAGSVNGLRVSNTNFADIDSSYATQFNAFSAPRTFANIENKTSEIIFKVPGTSTAASVKGFGAIFSDVDDFNSTFIEFFKGNKSLGKYYAPVRTANSSFSFLGVFFPEETVTHIKITSGNGVLAAGIKDVTNGGSKDLVVMDDFFYSEPKSIQ